MNRLIILTRANKLRAGWATDLFTDVFKERAGWATDLFTDVCKEGRMGD